MKYLIMIAIIATLTFAACSDTSGEASKALNVKHIVPNERTVTNSVTNYSNETFSPCFDTDGGINPNTFGIVSFKFNNTDENFTDKCISSVYLNENYCDGNYPRSINMTCSEGYCENGACVVVENNTNTTENNTNTTFTDSGVSIPIFTLGKTNQTNTTTGARLGYFNYKIENLGNIKTSVSVKISIKNDVEGELVNYVNSPVNIYAGGDVESSITPFSITTQGVYTITATLITSDDNLDNNVVTDSFIYKIPVIEDIPNLNNPTP